MIKTLLTLVCAFLLFSSSLCFAVVFDNLSPAGTEYNPWYTLGRGYTQGFAFKAINTESLTDIEIVLGNNPGGFGAGTGNPIIGLYNADSSWAKGVLLESWTVDHTSLTPTEGYKTKHVTTLTSISHAMLTAGSNYWIIGTNDLDTNTAWYLNNNLDYQSYYSQYSSFPSTITNALSGAFAVNAAPGSPVPEPTTIIMLGVGLAGIGFIRRRMQK